MDADRIEIADGLPWTPGRALVVREDILHREAPAGSKIDVEVVQPARLVVDDDLVRDRLFVGSVRHDRLGWAPGHAAVHRPTEEGRTFETKQRSSAYSRL